MMELMRELSLTPGVSGSEEKIAEIITRELKDVADKIETDSMGNIIATKKGEKKAPTVMLASHMDEIGLMVRYIDDDGFIKFSNIGGINDQMLMNQTVTVHSSVGEPIVGVIGSKPPHVTTAEEWMRRQSEYDCALEEYATENDIGQEEKFVLRNLKEEIITIGDNINDKKMIINAGIGIAMGQSTQKLTEVADYVTDDNNSDGVANAIMKFI